MQTKWKDVAAAFAAFASIISIGLPAAIAQTPETKLIRFVAVPSAGSSLVWIATEKGFDKQEGIEIQIRRDLAAGLITLARTIPSIVASARGSRRSPSGRPARAGRGASRAGCCST